MLSDGRETEEEGTDKVVLTVDEAISEASEESFVSAAERGAERLSILRKGLVRSLLDIDFTAPPVDKEFPPTVCSALRFFLLLALSNHPIPPDSFPPSSSSISKSSSTTSEPVGVANVNKDGAAIDVPIIERVCLNPEEIMGFLISPLKFNPRDVTSILLLLLGVSKLEWDDALLDKRAFARAGSGRMGR